MHKLTLKLTLFLSLLTGNVLAEEGRTYMITGKYVCSPFDKVKESLKEVGELPMMVGDGATTLSHPDTGEVKALPHKMYIFADPKTYEWSLVFVMKSETGEVGCVTSIGEKLRPALDTEGAI